MTDTATFAARATELVVIEKMAEPVYEGGRQVGLKPGKAHKFIDGRCVVEGKRSIEFMRARAHAADGPGIYEIDAADVRSVEDLLAELAVADIDQVREILEEERSSADRPQVTNVAEAILEKAGAPERKPGGQRHEVIAT